MHRRSSLIILGLFLVSMAFASSSLAQSPSKTPPAQSAPAASAPIVGDDYKIGPQDVIQIDVWKEPEITRTIPVRPDGKVSIPLLNDVQAAGLTAMQLSNYLRDALAKFVNNPQVTVTVTQINSRRVYITGEIAHSGMLPLLPNMTVLEAIASSGGFTQFAREKGIYILRKDNGKQTKIPFNYKAVVKGDHPEQNIILQPGDVIVVP